jgi:hypothetical protein
MYINQCYIFLLDGKYLYKTLWAKNPIVAAPTTTAIIIQLYPLKLI